MPQLDPTYFPTQLFWLVICFVILYLVMWKIALPRIADVLRERQERVDDDLEKAESLKADAQQVLETYQKTMADGRNEAQSILRTAKEKISADGAARLTELSERLATETANAEARIAEAQQEALANIRGVAVETAQAAATRLIGREVSSADADSAVGTILAERG
ncbi:MAG: F-type H+-transporting ATPase subunit b [Alphaproteobacteria bacterium]|jgi:F-type H+-transporting ATPase subunit b